MTKSRKGTIDAGEVLASVFRTGAGGGGLFVRVAEMRGAGEGAFDHAFEHRDQGIGRHSAGRGGSLQVGQAALPTLGLQVIDGGVTATATVTIAVAWSPSASSMVYVNESLPLKPAFGV